MSAMPAQAAALRIGGFVPFTSVDFPGALAAVVFCQGCPLRCVYCHNPALLPSRGAAQIEWDDVYTHLAGRVGLLDAVVFSGGEPLMQRALPFAMRVAKDFGYKIGLHTSGITPDRLRNVVPLLDWVGFDVKAPFHKYETVTRVEQSGEKARQSLTMLAAAGVDIEARTTIWPGAVDASSVRAFAEEIATMGVRKFTIQEARDPQTKLPARGKIFSDHALQEKLRTIFSEFSIRRVA